MLMDTASSRSMPGWGTGGEGGTHAKRAETPTEQVGAAHQRRAWVGAGGWGDACGCGQGRPGRAGPGACRCRLREAGAVQHGQPGVYYTAGRQPYTSCPHVCGGGAPLAPHPTGAHCPPPLPPTHRPPAHPPSVAPVAAALSLPARSTSISRALRTSAGLAAGQLSTCSVKRAWERLDEAFRRWQDMTWAGGARGREGREAGREGGGRGCFPLGVGVEGGQEWGPGRGLGRAAGGYGSHRCGVHTAPVAGSAVPLCQDRRLVGLECVVWTASTRATPGIPHPNTTATTARTTLFATPAWNAARASSASSHSNWTERGWGHAHATRAGQVRSGQGRSGQVRASTWGLPRPPHNPPHTTPSLSPNMAPHAPCDIPPPLTLPAYSPALLPLLPPPPCLPLSPRPSTQILAFVMFSR